MAFTHPQPFIESFRSLSLTSTYDQSAFSAVAIAMLGQIVAIISIIAHNKNLLLGSIFILWLGFFVLTRTLFKDDLAMFSFCTGLPFFSLSIVTFYLTLRDIKATD
ncbi:hypothetical protein LT679_13465 [Mucilaginibacter roseus]|uniref:Uncharacterized protein n=1 Tax=Mucilaginibacter roseus TaxID=1528868 RepID=A0ABS8U7F3_9SPHI|nr:hypothetical protein [Mucilaginibacter roseus]MCD8741616.1 hypothetical protein [Mucilaginibacter roseus]